MRAFRFYDFFAGAGMVELALAPEWRCIWANDVDPRKAAVHAANFDHSIYHTADIATVGADELPEIADMAWASFPCQDLSLAGWRRGMGANRSGTFWSFWRIMRDLNRCGQRPPVIAVENVVGLLYGDNFSGLCEALAALDMNFGALVIDADKFLPQSRPRVFIVAVDSAINVRALQTPKPELSSWFPKRLWAVWNSLPVSLRERWLWWSLPMPMAPITPVQSLIEEDPIDVAWHSQAETERLMSLMSAVNRRKVDDAVGNTERTIGFVYKRTRTDGQRAEVRFDGVAGCLRTPYGGSSRQIVLVAEHGRVRTRLLSAREAARLMGAPDNFALPARYNDAYRAMGDGVAIPAVSWLGRHLLTPLARLAASSAPLDSEALDHLWLQEHERTRDVGREVARV